MTKIQFQCLESSEALGPDVTKEVWFITDSEGHPIRRTIYKAEDNSVVAFKDSGKYADKDLFVEHMFYELNKGEDAWEAIQYDSGVFCTPHIHFFDLR